MRGVLGFALFVAAYWIGYRQGMSFSQAVASPFWFPDSVLLCALLLNRPSRWWLFALAPLPIRLIMDVPQEPPAWFVLTTYSIDVTRALVTAALLRRFIANPTRLETVRDFAVFCLFAVFLVPAVGALGGAWARTALGHEFWPAWRQWLMGDALAHLVVTPAILYWIFGSHWPLRLPEPRRVAEAVVLAAGLLVTGFLAFDMPRGGTGFSEPLFFAPVPFLFWAAIRFGMRGASGAITAIAFISVAAALAGRGPFSGMEPGDTALALQHFLLLRAVPLYVVAILIEQNAAFERSLREREVETHRQRIELAHAGRVSTMGQLATALAHEINQPLGAILQNAEAAELILAQRPLDEGEIRAILSDIRRDDERAGAVISRMRSMLKRHELELEALPVAQLLDETLMLTRSEMRTRGVTLELELPPHLPPVRGDRVHLQQVLLNLLVNGAEAMAVLAPGERRLEVRARLIDEHTVEIAVSDSGHGIRDQDLARMFEPFFTTKPEGMGMGLAISRTIVESHGGRIWAENNPDGGTTFRFTLEAAGALVA
jgi:signal transduction histidine kinase